MLLLRFNSSKMNLIYIGRSMVEMNNMMFVIVDVNGGHTAPALIATVIRNHSRTPASHPIT
jgi:hypothetical protein